MRDGASPHDLLAALVESGIRLREFRRVEPSLERIFIERVGATPQELEAMDAHEDAAAAAAI